jgi:hypothetical protein
VFQNFWSLADFVVVLVAGDSARFLDQGERGDECEFGEFDDEVPVIFLVASVLLLPLTVRIDTGVR